ncbi:Oxysterol-binding protein 4 [Coemansia sp. S85]|nr:Oxysterol-binding protein 4 [Coemansia sp. S85]
MTSDSKSVSSNSSGRASSGRATPVVEPTGDIVPAARSGDFVSFLKDVLSFTGDLSSMTCPSFLLNGISLLEYG